MAKFNRYHSIGQFAQVYKQIQHDTAFCGVDDVVKAIAIKAKDFFIDVLRGIN
jgi:hypothetical protein